MTPAQQRWWPLEFTVLAAIWGSSFLFMRLSVVEFGPWATAAMRVGVAALVLLPLLWARGLWPELRRHWGPVLFVGIINAGLPFACYAFALLHISTGLSSILNATTPLFGALVAWLWLGDRPGRERIAGLLLGFAGVALLAASRTQGSLLKDGPWQLLAMGACLVSTLCYGISASFTRRYLPGLTPLVTATGSLIGATLALLVPAVWTWPAHTPSLGAWTALIVAGVLCTGVAYVLYFRLIDSTGPARALTVTFAVPVFALLYGVSFLSEQVTGAMLGCGVLIVLGTALSSGLLKWGAKP